MASPAGWFSECGVIGPLLIDVRIGTRGHREGGYLPVRGEGIFTVEVVVMDVLVDAGAGIRLRPADLPLVLQEQLDLLATRRDAGASDAELAGLVAELQRLREW